MSEERLTKRQKEVFKQICKYIDENGYSPSIRELCKLCGLSSSATMFAHLQKLRDKGFIYFEDKKFRTIKTNLQNDLEQKYERLLQIAKKMHTWIFLHSGDEQAVYDELGLTDEENAMLGYSGQLILGDKENE